jgi:predicted transposase YdaD
MAKKYDVGVKVLFDPHLPDWLTLVHRKPSGPTRIIDSDLATITADADKVLLIEDPHPWILHVELQAGFDRWLAERVAWYNALLAYKHKRPVHSMLVLLQRKADAPSLTGELLDRIAGEPPHRMFRYQIVRAWELDAEQLANGGWGLFPLAPLSDKAPPMIESLTDKMARKLAYEHPNIKEARELGAVMEILLGLRYPKELAQIIMTKVTAMIDLQESTTYQIIHGRGKAEGKAEGIAKGKADGIRETILRQGKKKLGKPSAKILRELNAVTDESRLAALSERILDVDSWKELLARPN